MLTTTNFAFREYFQGVVRTHDIYLTDPYTSGSSGQLQSVIAVPVYSLKNNSTLVGIWSGGIDFGVLDKELQSFNLTADGKRIVYVGHNGKKIAESQISSTSQLESFANLNRVKAFHNTWVVLLMQRN